MRFALFCLLATGAFSVARAQVVVIRNVSAPYTQLELGNTVEVVIAGAPASEDVYLDYTTDSYPPFYMGQTNSSGIWSIQAVEEPYHQGTHIQIWTVNGVQMTPLNFSNFWAPHAATLPTFTVHNNYTNSPLCPPASNEGIVGCGGTTTGRKWLWKPVTYRNDSSASGSEVSDAVGNWSSGQSKINFSSNTSARVDILIKDGTSDDAYGDTFTYGQNCYPCIGKINDCTGACTTLNGVGYVDMYLHEPHIEDGAAYFGISIQNLRTRSLNHEFGHALRLEHTNTDEHRCSEVQSVMNPSQSVLLGCGISEPTSCDFGAINSLYSTTVPSCPATASNHCTAGNPC